MKNFAGFISQFFAIFLVFFCFIYVGVQIGLAKSLTMTREETCNQLLLFECVGEE